MNITRRRTRFVIGLVLVLTMGVSLAETVRAAACSPNMGGDMSPASLAMEGVPGMDDMAAESDRSGANTQADHDCMPGHGPDPSHQGSGAPPCPFSPAGAAQGCAVTASLPASVEIANSPTPVDVLLAPSTEAAPHLLRAASIFRPPKA